MTWHPTLFGFTDDIHYHHCMVTTYIETCDYLNSVEKSIQRYGKRGSCLHQPVTANVRKVGRAQDRDYESECRYCGQPIGTVWIVREEKPEQKV